MKEHLLKTYQEYLNDPFVNSNSTISKLLGAIVDSLYYGENKIHEEWVTATRFEEKYKIMTAAELHKFRRFIKEFDKIYKQKGRFKTFNTELVFKYIIENKHNHPKIYNRLKKQISDKNIIYRNDLLSDATE